jgi:DNA-binding transcriptional LysR family regulator
MQTIKLLEQMQIFSRVAEMASFTRAADSMGLPKASVSQAVQQLEARLGTRLLHRTTRRAAQDGQACYERCQDLLADVDEFQGQFQQAGDAPLQGKVRLDATTGLARHVVMPLLPQLLQSHPALELELSCTERRVDLVREGFDCVLRLGRGRAGLVAARWAGWRWSPAPARLCAGPRPAGHAGRPGRTPAGALPAHAGRAAAGLRVRGGRPGPQPAHGGRAREQRRGLSLGLPGRPGPDQVRAWPCSRCWMPGS